MITFALVRVGDYYPIAYVERMRNMIKRHAPFDHRIICLTDRDDEVHGVEMIDVSRHGLTKWWPKMLLFDPAVRNRGRCIYLDLDTVIIDTLRPLAELNVPFGICASFTRRAGHLDWPCAYGSCVMSFSDCFGYDIAKTFLDNSDSIMSHCGKYGDQLAIETLHPGAALLQDHLPHGYFVGRREMSHVRPKGCSLLIFAGPEKPHNTRHQWIRKEWQ